MAQTLVLSDFVEELVNTGVLQINLSQQQGVVDDACLREELSVLVDDPAEGTTLLEKLVQFLIALI